MEDTTKNKREEIHVCGFVGFWIKGPEEVLENGNLFQRTAYLLTNVYTGQRLAGIAGTPEKATECIRKRVMEYYEDHPEEFEELKKQQEHGNNN